MFCFCKILPLGTELASDTDYSQQLTGGNYFFSMWHQIGCWQDHLLVQVRLGTPRGAHPGVKSGFPLCSGGTQSSRRDHEDGPALFMAFCLRQSACPTIKKEKKGKLYTVSDTLNPALSCWNAASLWSLIWSDPCLAQSCPSNSKTVGMRLQDILNTILLLCIILPG